MKRIKAINGYTIYEVTARDEKQGNGTAGEFSIYFSSDVREYGVAYSTPDYDGIDSLKVALELISDPAAVEFAEVKEELEQESTAVTYDMIEERLQERKTAQIFEAIRAEADNRKTRGAWSAGVNEYAHELIDGLQEAIEDGYFALDDLEAPRLVEKALLNGAGDWSTYSWGGCSLIYNGQIARRLCNPSELKKTDNGRKDPNPREQWLDTQARALFQAAQIVKDAVRKAVTV